MQWMPFTAHTEISIIEIQRYFIQFLTAAKKHIYLVTRWIRFSLKYVKEDYYYYYLSEDRFGLIYIQETFLDIIPFWMFVNFVLFILIKYKLDEWSNNCVLVVVEMQEMSSNHFDRIRLAKTKIWKK